MAADRLRNFGFMIKDVTRLYSLNFERHATELNLTLTQCKVLAHLQRNEGITQVRLAELSDVDQMTLVRVIDRMEADGWVERAPHPTDRRARCLNLKPAATPILQQMWRLADRARSAALAGLSAAEAEQLLSLLERVHSNLGVLTGSDAAAKAVCAPIEEAGRTARSTRTKPQPVSKPGISKTSRKSKKVKS